MYVIWFWVQLGSKPLILVISVILVDSFWCFDAGKLAHRLKSEGAKVSSSSVNTFMSLYTSYYKVKHFFWRLNEILYLNMCRYYWRLVIRLGQLRVTNWKFGLKEPAVRLCQLRRRRQKHQQVDTIKSRVITLTNIVGYMAATITNMWSWSSFWVVLSQAVKKGKEQGFDIVLCDTSGRKTQCWSTKLL